MGQQKILTVQLAKNLRRQVLRGHPWVYRDALQRTPNANQAQLCELIDSKGAPLAWAMYDPNSVLAIRVLSIDKKPPGEKHWERKLQAAVDLRKSVVNDSTDCYRLINGEGDQMPGLVCDRYADVIVMQFDGQGPGEFWDKTWIADWLIKNTNAKSVVEKARRNDDGKALTILSGSVENTLIRARENSVQFDVDIESGQKTGFFLDQRDNRQYVRSIAKDLKVLNLFSYTGGFSVYAGLGGAKSVTSVDLSKGAIEQAQSNWQINDLPADKHQGVAADVFDYIQGQDPDFDMVIVDPPSMAHSEKQKPQAVKKYAELFAAAIRCLKPDGHLILSSCSSHISFDDFYEIANQALSARRKQGQVLHISGQGPDHPFPHVCFEMRYLKFLHLRL